MNINERLNSFIILLTVEAFRTYLYLFFYFQNSLTNSIDMSGTIAEKIVHFYMVTLIPVIYLINSVCFSTQMTQRNLIPDSLKNYIYHG